MKKILLASTALVLAAGVASADIKLTGGANVGVKYNSEAGNDANDLKNGKASDNMTLHNEIDFDIVATGETDGGLSFGASIDLDASSNDSGFAADNTSRDPEVFVSAGGLKVTVGDIAEANDFGDLSDVGYDGINMDDVVDDIAERGAHDYRIDYAFDSFTFAMSGDSSNKTWAAAVEGSFDFGTKFNFGLAYADLETNTSTAGKDTIMNVKLGFDIGDYAFDLYATQNDVKDGKSSGLGLDAEFTFGDLAVTAVVAQSTVEAKGAKDQKVNAFGIGASYDLGGGASLAGGIGQTSYDPKTTMNGKQVDSVTTADLGLVFTF